MKTKAQKKISKVMTEKQLAEDAEATLKEAIAEVKASLLAAA
jgi:hypothetical protein